MQLGLILRGVVVCLLSIIAAPVYADVIELPEEELATESVLPVFDKTVVVRERAVKTEGRFELGGGLGLNLAEPLYGQMAFDITATYHLNEIHGLSFLGMFLDTGLSNAGQDLKSGVGTGGNEFHADLAPTLESMFFGNYEFTAYYGKMSVTKNTAMNLALYGTAGVGLANWSDATQLALDVGIGQKLFFTPNLAFRLDFFFAMYMGPDPTDPKGATNDLNTGPTRDSDDFESTFYIRPFLLGSLIGLF